MTLPIDRSTLVAAQGNQIAGVVASAAKNIAAMEVLFDGVDEVSAKVDAHATGSVLPHADGSVTTEKLANQSVDSNKIKDGSVTAAKILDGNVTTPKIADSGITTPKIADAGVTTSKIADRGITSSKIELRAIKGEHIDASVTSETINGARIDTLTAQLAEKATVADVNLLETNKADLSYVDAQLATKRNSTATHPINVNEMDTETKALFTGGSVAVVGVNSTGTENIKNQNVTPEKISFLTIGKNLYDHSRRYVNQFVNNTTGVLSASTDYDTSYYIKAISGQPMAINKQMRKLALFDTNYNYVSGVDNPTSPYTPASDGYVLISMYKNTQNLATTQIEYGSASTSYEQIRYTVDSKIKVSNDNNNLLYGLHLLNFGDSIADGDGNDGISYADIIATEWGMSITKYSRGGATIAKRQTSPNTLNITDQLDQAISAAVQPNFILFNGSANDESYVTTLGDITTGYAAALDLTTFSGGFEYMCKTILTNFPGIPVLYIRHHNMESRPDNLQKSYGNRAVDICKKWGVQVVDIYSESGMNTWITYHYQNYTASYLGSPDGTHPNNIAYNTFYVPLIKAAMLQKV